MKFVYHKFNWQSSSQIGKIKFTDDSGNNMRLYKRKYDNQGAYYYMFSHVFPTLYIYSGDFIDQLYDYCQTVKSKCTENSIVEAFSDCPNIYKLLTEEKFGNCHIEDMAIDGKITKCLAVCYPSFLLTKEMMYNRLAKMEKTLREETHYIKKYELKGKWDTLKKIGAGVFKVAAKVGVALAAGAMGANLDIDIPDFDFGDSMPDIDFDANLDFDADIDFDDQLALDSNLDNGYNVSFGASENSDGYIPDGKISLERTISGDSDTFPHYTKDGHDYVKLGPGNYVRVDQGNTVNLRGVKYDTI